MEGVRWGEMSDGVRCNEGWWDTCDRKVDV